MKNFSIKYLSIALVVMITISIAILPKQKVQSDILPDYNTLENILTPLHEQNSNYSITNTNFKIMESSRAVTGALSFSKNSGYYQSALSLNILCDNSTYKIRYTINGNMPTTSSIEYSDTISISNKSSMDPKTDFIVVIRAAAFNGNTIVDDKVYTMIYIINSNPFQARYSMPVISLVTDNSNLHGSNGIMDNPIKSGREWERPVNVTFFETDSTIKFSIDAGIRMFGGTSRNNPYIKSFKIIVRKEYDLENGMFKHEIFPGLKDKFGNVIKKYNGFILSNAGNDSIVNDYRASQTRDGFIHRLADTTGVDYMDYRPAIVYLNGAYYGTLNLREIEDENYIESHYNIPNDKVTVVGNGNYLQGQMNDILLDNGPVNEVKQYWAMVNYIIGNNMSTPSKYEEACRKLDVDSFIKYMAFEMYVVNLDWPHNNIRAWRYNGSINDSLCQDGKWRYMLKDLDFGFSRYPETTSTANTVTSIINGNDDTFKLKRMVKSLLANKEFKNKFSSYLCDMVNDVMEPNRVIGEINRAKDEYNLEIDYMIKKYGIKTTHAIWNQTFATMTTFAKNRGNLYIQWANSALQLSGTAYVTVNKSPYGVIKVNTVSVPSGSGAWSGKYFKNVPFSLSVIPNSDYRFTGFTVTGGKIADNTMTIDGDATITASFDSISNPTTTVDPGNPTDFIGNPVDSSSNPNNSDTSSNSSNYPSSSSPSTTIDSKISPFVIVGIVLGLGVISARITLFIIYRRNLKCFYTNSSKK